MVLDEENHKSCIIVQHWEKYTYQVLFIVTNIDLNVLQDKISTLFW